VVSGQGQVPTWVWVRGSVRAWVRGSVRARGRSRVERRRGTVPAVARASMCRHVSRVSAASRHGQCTRYRSSLVRVMARVGAGVRVRVRARVKVRVRARPVPRGRGRVCGTRPSLRCPWGAVVQDRNRGAHARVLGLGARCVCSCRRRR
jgi:hypothetical protein